MNHVIECICDQIAALFSAREHSRSTSGSEKNDFGIMSVIVTAHM